MFQYDPKSSIADEFINDGEIQASLAYAEANKNNKEVIDAIIKKAREMKGLTHREAAVLLECELEEENKEIEKLAKEIKERFYGKRIVMFAPLGMIFFMGSALSKLNIVKAQGMFWIFSILMGLSLSNIFFIYSSGSIVRTFLVSAATFGGMSLYGYTTKRSLYGLGSFLIMGLWGMIIASIVNIFMHSSSLDWMLSFLGVGIFTGLTAYDTQQLRAIYSENDVTDVQEAKAISGALSLYLNFINLFVSLLRLLGNRE